MKSGNLRLRRRERGAALVEAVVVVPVFILLFGGMLFLHHVISEKQRTMREARNTAWASAMRGCTGQSVSTPDLNSTMPGAPGSEVALNEQMGKANGESSGFVSVSALGGYGGAGGATFSQSVNANATVFCNNVTRPGSVGGVFGWLFATGGGIGTFIGDLL